MRNQTSSYFISLSWLLPHILLTQVCNLTMIATGRFINSFTFSPSNRTLKLTFNSMIHCDTPNPSVCISFSYCSMNCEVLILAPRRRPPLAFKFNWWRHGSHLARADVLQYTYVARCIDYVLILLYLVLRTHRSYVPVHVQLQYSMKGGSRVVGGTFRSIYGHFMCILRIRSIKRFCVSLQNWMSVHQSEICLRNL